MPQFELDRGSPTSAAWLASLDQFTQSYIEALVFTEEGADDGKLGEVDLDQLSQSARDIIVSDCAAFQREAGDYCLREYDENQAGHDFWMTRNGHGVGFWECQHATNEICTVLDTIAKDAGSCDVYRGDDGLIYVTSYSAVTAANDNDTDEQG